MTKRTMAGLIALTLMPVLGAARDYHGVNWNRVDWKQLCASVKPLEYRTEQGHACPKVHPTASQWEKWRDMTGRNKPEPDWDCSQLAQHFDTYRKDPGLCREAFRKSLARRTRYQERYTEPFETWRSRYFGPWLVGKK